LILENYNFADASILLLTFPFSRWDAREPPNAWRIFVFTLGLWKVDKSADISILLTFGSIRMIPASGSLCGTRADSLSGHALCRT
jgi:hypothetical protein